METPDPQMTWIEVCLTSLFLGVLWGMAARMFYEVCRHLGGE